MVDKSDACSVLSKYAQSLCLWKAGEEIRVEVQQVIYIYDCYKFPKVGSRHLKHRMKDYGIKEYLKSKSNMGIYMASMERVFIMEHPHSQYP